MKVKIRVTKELFDISHCGQAEKCIIANAISSVLKEGLIVSVFIDISVFDKGDVQTTLVKQDLGPKMHDLIVDFDSLSGCREQIERLGEDQCPNSVKVIQNFLDEWLGKDLEIDLPEHVLDIANIGDVEEILVAHEVLTPVIA